MTFDVKIQTETTAMNPQFFVQIPRTAATSSKCHVVVSVTQHYETRDGLLLLGKQKKISAGGCASGNGNSNGGGGSGGSGSALNRSMHAIGFAVYEVPPNVNRLTAHFVAEHVIICIPYYYYYYYYQTTVRITHPIV